MKERMSAAEYQRKHGRQAPPQTHIVTASGMVPVRGPDFVNFKIERLPPSVNHAYMNIPGRGRVLTKEARAFKAEVELLARAAGPIAKADWYELRVTFALPMLYKNGKPRRWDGSNAMKLLEDAVAAGLGFDDCRFRRIDHCKCDSAARSTCVNVQVFKGGRP